VSHRTNCHENETQELQAVLSSGALLFGGLVWLVLLHTIRYAWGASLN
jgi:hypothetical protein